MMLLKIAGFRVFLEQLKRQVYSRETQVGLDLKLQEANVPVHQAKIKYNLSLASEKDIEEALQKAGSESKESVQKLLYRKWLYESGFRNWYIARTADTGDICYMESVIDSEDYKHADGDFSNWLPELKEGEALVEGAYTFEKYRGQKLSTAVSVDLVQIYKKKGFSRILTYIEKNNIPPQKVVEAVGFTRFEEIPVLRIFFLNLRKFNGVR
ncbi:MAG: hypothetical protein A2144_05180 [Chloroflexi bacterium RBG_16_50_9]|nr:MAG: hypothetical protein A2144_05180 [Chloroflexi bacterium RBG_16_50_9]